MEQWDACYFHFLRSILTACGQPADRAIIFLPEDVSWCEGRPETKVFSRRPDDIWDTETSENSGYRPRLSISLDLSVSEPRFCFQMTCKSEPNLNDREIEALRIFGAMAESAGIAWAVVTRMPDEVASHPSGTIRVIISRPFPGKDMELSRTEQDVQIHTAKNSVTIRCSFSRFGNVEILADALDSVTMLDGIPALPVEWSLILRQYAGTPEDNRYVFRLIGELDGQTFRRFRRILIKHLGKDAWNFGRSGYRVNRE